MQACSSRNDMHVHTHTLAPLHTRTHARLYIQTRTHTPTHALTIAPKQHGKLAQPMHAAAAAAAAAAWREKGGC